MRSEILKTFPEKSIIFTVAEEVKLRSNQANAYYWGVLIPECARLFKEEGILSEPEQVHDILKYKFLSEIAFVDPDTGEALCRTKSTSELSRAEFETYQDEIRAWIYDFFAYQIPRPNEQVGMFNYE